MGSAHKAAGPPATLPSSLPRSAPTSPAVAVRGARSGGAGRARCGGPAGAGAGPGAGRREPGWIARFQPDSPSALPAESVLLGDHVTRAAFDPGLGAGRGRGPRARGVSGAGPARAVRRGPGPGGGDPERTKPWGSQQVLWGQGGTGAGGRRGGRGKEGGTKTRSRCDLRPGIALPGPPELRVRPRSRVTTLRGLLRGLRTTGTCPCGPSRAGLHTHTPSL